MAQAGSNPVQWADLKQRLLSAIAMAAVALIAVILGGLWFQILVVFAAAVMIWELWMMTNPDAPEYGMVFASLGASVLAGVVGAADWAYMGLLLLIPVIGAVVSARESVRYFGFALAIQLACWGLIAFRAEFGAIWILWLLIVVIATDVAGYFAGRLIGGPKFWPSVSPKKTWSGTAAGWIAALIVGVVFWQVAGASWLCVPISVVLSFASQLGDLAESALKRRVGVKDSSDLIPGHGGLFDRFDGMLGALLAMLLIALVINGGGW